MVKNMPISTSFGQKRSFNIGRTKLCRECPFYLAWALEVTVRFLQKVSSPDLLPLGIVSPTLTYTFPPLPSSTAQHQDSHMRVSGIPA